MLGFLAKIFGSKSERDIKLIQPLVVKINEHYSKLSALSHDELRGKTIEFKSRIADFLTEIDGKISALKTEAENEELDLHEKTAI